MRGTLVVPWERPGSHRIPRKPTAAEKCGTGGGQQAPHPLPLPAPLQSLRKLVLAVAGKVILGVGSKFVPSVAAEA